MIGSGSCSIRSWVDEYLRAVHPPAGRHHPADDRRRACRRDRLPVPAGLAACRKSIFRPFSVQAQLPGASPETMASSVATPLERQFGRIAGVTEMTSSSSLGSTSHRPAIRSESEHRCRRARRAGRDQCGARPAAGQLAEQPDIPQSQSGRCADPDSGADLRSRRARPHVRRRVISSAAETLAGRRRRPGVRRRRRAAGRAGGRQSHGPESLRA